MTRQRSRQESSTRYREHGYVLTPGRYVGSPDAEEDGELFEDKMKRLAAQLADQFTESAKLEKTIKENLGRMGFGLESRR